ncbi:MAG: pyruvate dehydrogenase E2 component (dihydrolipoamide acetyltransferase), partial [Algoriphagus sp.]
MAEIIRMPKMSDTMEEGVIAAWLKKVGDAVKPGDILAEVETDKATMELESYDEGVLLYIGVQEKDSVPVNGIIAIIGEKDEKYEDLLKEALESSDESKAKAPAKEENKEDIKEQQPDSKPKAEKINTSSINATLITMPKMSDTMQEGTISTWLKKVGDVIKSGEIIAEVETDKATMELESYEDGTLLYIGVEAGDSVPVDGVIAVIGEKGSDFETLLKAHQSEGNSEEEAPEPAPKVSKSEEPKQTAHDTNPTTVANSSAGDRIIASPLAKKMAEDKGFDISQVNGSGEGGRIIK